MKKLFFSYLVFSLIIGGISAQIGPRMDISFFQDEHELLHPLAGGLNLPELSAVDFNNDGILDIHLFDKTGNRQLFFERTSDEEGFNFRYAPEYAEYFPPVREWVLFRDYNGDGIQDIFAFSDQGVGGIIVYRGYYQDDIIHFERFNFNENLNLIYFPVPGSTARAQIYVSKIDYPAIDDIDCDGDLDIVTFAGGGKNIQWFRNTSVENGYDQDSLIFVIEDHCWGGVFESGETNEVDLSNTPGECANDYRSEDLDFRHTGSTLLTFDGDNDGDKELLLGDAAYSEVVYLTNGGDCNEAWFNEQDSNFPNYDTPINIPNFPTTFHIDLDNDGKKDLVAATNDLLAYSEDYEVCWFYKNIGTEENPNFHLTQKNAFVNEMIDVGTSARPAVADVNGDGLPDIIIGNESRYTQGEERSSRLVLYQNIGSINQPSFERVDIDFLNMSQFDTESYGFSPCFGDLDGDGDLDIIVGDVLGTLFYGENTATSTSMMQVNSFVRDYQQINIGFEAKPQLVDANRDGLLDLLVGESSGNINYFQNQGTAENPVFDHDEENAPNNWFFGQVDTRIPGYPTGHSSPFLFETEAGLQLITGSKNGQLEYYGAIDENFDGIFPILSDNLGNLKEGANTHISLADLNGDGLLELIIGNQSGGITIYETSFPDKEIVSTNTPGSLAFPVATFPNPSKEIIHINTLEGSKKLEIFTPKGKLMDVFYFNERTYDLPLHDLPSGLYFIKVSLEDKSVIQKIIKS